MRFRRVPLLAGLCLVALVVLGFGPACAGQSKGSAGGKRNQRPPKDEDLVLPEIEGEKIFEMLAEYDSVFLFLYAPSCERCPQLEKDIARVAHLADWSQFDLSQNQTNILFTKLNVREQAKTAQMLKVDGTPTMLLIKGPWINEYTGLVNVHHVAPWIARRVGDLAKRLEDKVTAKAFLDETEGTAILAIGSEAVHDLFEFGAGSEREFAEFAFLLNPDAEKNATKGELIVSKWGQKDPQKFDIDFQSHQKVYELVQKNQVPLFAPMTAGNVMELLAVDPSKSLVILYCQEQRDATRFRDDFRDMIVNSDEIFGAKLQWTYIVANTQPTARQFAFETFSIPTTAHAALVVSKLEDNGRYVMDGVREIFDLTKRVQAVENFIKKSLDGTEEKTFQTERHIPEKQRYPLSGTKMISRHGSHELYGVLVTDRPFSPAPDSLFDAAKDGSAAAKAAKAAKGAEGPVVKRDLVVYFPKTCDPTVCFKRFLGKLLPAMKSKVDACGLRVLFVDGRRNEFDDAWGMQIEPKKAPNVWVFNTEANVKTAKKNGKDDDEDLGALEKMKVDFEVGDSVTTMAEKICAELGTQSSACCPFDSLGDQVDGDTTDKKSEEL